MQPTAAELRRSAVIRVLISVLAAAALTAIAILVAWGPLNVKTDVIGYPTFQDFNPDNYFIAYYMAVGFFPLAALGLFLGLTRLGPRIGLAAPPERGGLRPTAPADEEGSALEAEPPLAKAPDKTRRAVGAARIGFVGAVLGFEAGVAANELWVGVASGIAAYALVLLLAARIFGARIRPEWAPHAHLAGANSLGAVLTVIGLVVVSINTEVTVASTGAEHHYHWLPLWLGLPLFAAIAAWVAVALRRTESGSRAWEFERNALTLVAAPAALFLLLQVMFGDVGTLEGFHFGEQLGGARLVGDGWLPWRDVVLTHGLLQDVIYTYGRGVFGDSVWGFLTGVGMIMAPLYLISVYFLCVYLLGRNWLFLLFAAVILIDPKLSPEHFRLILWPPILLVLATQLNRPTALKAVGLAFLVVIQTILAPEAAPAVLAVGGVLVLYEWYWRESGTSLVSAFPRTLWFAGGCIALAAAFCGYLAARGALDDLVYISSNLLHEHALSGAVPPSPGPGSISKSLFGFLALAPPGALLISFAYLVVRLRLRRRFRTADWVMLAAAIFLLFYYPKFLARMDTGHVYQPYVVALPLLFFIAYRAVGAVEELIRERWPRSLTLRVTAHPVSLLLVGLMVVLTWGSLNNRVENAPNFHHAVATEEPQFERVGYTQAFDGAAYRDVKRVVNAYLDPDDRIFDFSNTPLLFHYLLGRDPSTRYFHVAVASSAELQSDLIERLRGARPKLIVFDNDGVSIIGLSNWDGIPNMVRLYEVGQWVLDHYRPLLWTHGYTIYARRDMPSSSKVHLGLSEPPITRGVAFSVQPCLWGSAPNFLSGAAEPRPGARAVTVQTRAVSPPNAPALKPPVLRLELPPHSHWADYQWLEIEADRNGFRDGYFAVFDRASRPSPGREISFQTLDRSANRYVVPVGSCAQWHGYQSRQLFLDIPHDLNIDAVRLIR